MSKKGNERQRSATDVHVVPTSVDSEVADPLSHRATPAQAEIEYYPPPAKVIDQFAQNLCLALSQQIDAAFAAPGVAIGLANFFKVVARICANQLNAQSGSGNIDTDHEAG